MMRLAYAIAWLLAVPAILVRLAWRARRQPGYLHRVGERFGGHPHAPAPKPLVWIHAVSVGETRAAAPVVEALRARLPGYAILLTHMTPTGRETGATLFGDRVVQAWLPYDLGFAVRAFLRHYRPAFGLVMETEVWPRLLEECRRSGVPVVLANARLSERSARGYARVPTLARWAFGNLAAVAAQGEADASRCRALGARDVVVTGNVKFDLAVPEAARAMGLALRDRIGERPLWVAGSTREGEEAQLLDAFAASAGAGDALLAIVPRHPDRFDQVEALALERGLAVARRSAGGPLPAGTRVLLGDSMGEMLGYYAAADVVIMGGSLLEYGSQNLIEPCALGRPVIVGPSRYNFEDAARGALEAGAAMAVADAGEAIAAAAALTADGTRREAMGKAGLAFVAAHRGAVDRLMGVVSRLA